MMDLESLIQSRSKRVDAYFFRQRLILIFISGFTLAIFVSSFVFISPLASVYLLTLALIVLLAEKVWHKEVQKEVVIVAVVLIAFSLGSLRYAVKDFHIPDLAFEQQVGQEVEFTGVIVSEPELMDSSTRFIVRAKSEKILVTADMYAGVEYGDEVKVIGKLNKPGLIDPSTSSGQVTGKPFDYRAYLAKDDIYFTASFSDVEILSKGNGNPLRSALFAIKRSFVSRTKDIFTEPQASLLAGLVVSGKDSMPKDIIDEFRRAGVVHIVVLSGYNITIIADFLRKGFERMFLATRIGANPSLAAGASIAGIVFFVIMTGAEATVVRASLMVLAVIAAKMFGRKFSAPRALLGAAFLMILHNPKILVFDPSFQLSFLATSALIYVVPIVERYVSRGALAKWDSVRTVVSTTIGTQLTVLPLLIYSMGNVSLVSLPSNMLILFFIPTTMLFGFIATTISYISALVAVPFAYLAHILLSWILVVSSFFGNLSFASISTPQLGAWFLVTAYTLLIILVWRLRRRALPFQPVP